MERIAHRGAKREFPENTLPAFERAFERRADAVELDVHATRDGVVVVHHDAKLSASLGGGSEIAASDWAELRGAELDDGSRIPRLEDVLRATPAGRTVYAEVKGHGIEALVVEVIRKCDTSCAIHSFDHAAITRVRDLAPDIPRGILFDERGVDVVNAMTKTGARDVWPHWKLIDAALVNLVHDNGGRVIAWTVNGRRAATTLTALGVDGLCGDDVRLFDEL